MTRFLLLLLFAFPALAQDPVPTRSPSPAVADSVLVKAVQAAVQTAVDSAL